VLLMRTQQRLAEWKVKLDPQLASSRSTSSAISSSSIASSTGSPSSQNNHLPHYRPALGSSRSTSSLTETASTTSSSPRIPSRGNSTSSAGYETSGHSTPHPVFEPKVTSGTTNKTDRVQVPKPASESASSKPAQVPITLVLAIPTDDGTLELKLSSTDSAKQVAENFCRENDIALEDAPALAAAIQARMDEAFAQEQQLAAALAEAAATEHEDPVSISTEHVTPIMSSRPGPMGKANDVPLTKSQLNEMASSLDTSSLYSSSNVATPAMLRYQDSVDDAALRVSLSSYRTQQRLRSPFQGHPTTPQRKGDLYENLYADAFRRAAERDRKAAEAKEARERAELAELEAARAQHGFFGTILGGAAKGCSSSRRRSTEPKRHSTVTSSSGSGEVENDSSAANQDGAEDSPSSTSIYDRLYSESYERRRLLEMKRKKQEAEEEALIAKLQAEGEELRRHSTQKVAAAQEWASTPFLDRITRNTTARAQATTTGQRAATPQSQRSGSTPRPATGNHDGHHHPTPRRGSGSQTDQNQHRTPQRPASAGSTSLAALTSRLTTPTAASLQRSASRSSAAAAATPRASLRSRRDRADADAAEESSSRTRTSVSRSRSTSRHRAQTPVQVRTNPGQYATQSTAARPLSATARFLTPTAASRQRSNEAQQQQSQQAGITPRRVQGSRPTTPQQDQRSAITSRTRPRSATPGFGSSTARDLIPPSTRTVTPRSTRPTTPRVESSSYTRPTQASRRASVVDIPRDSFIYSSFSEAAKGGTPGPRLAPPEPTSLSQTHPHGERSIFPRYVSTAERLAAVKLAREREREALRRRESSSPRGKQPSPRSSSSSSGHGTSGAGSGYFQRYSQTHSRQTSHDNAASRRQGPIEPQDRYSREVAAFTFDAHPMPTGETGYADPDEGLAAPTPRKSVPQPTVSPPAPPSPDESDLHAASLFAQSQQDFASTDDRDQVPSFVAFFMEMPANKRKAELEDICAHIDKDHDGFIDCSCYFEAKTLPPQHSKLLLSALNRLLTQVKLKYQKQQAKERAAGSNFAADAASNHGAGNPYLQQSPQDMGWMAHWTSWRLSRKQFFHILEYELQMLSSAS